MITPKDIAEMGANDLQLTEVKICNSDLGNKKPYFEAIEARRKVLSKEVDPMAVCATIKID